MKNKIDFSTLPTEQSNARTRHIDRRSIPDILKTINREDQRVPRLVANAIPQISAAVRITVRSLQSGGRIFFAGAGTSGRFGVMEAAECPPTFGTAPDLIQAIMAGGTQAVFHSKEGAEDEAHTSRNLFLKKLRRNDVLIGIAASGVTPFVLAAFQAAQRRGTKTIFITCNPKARIALKLDCRISVPTGSEVITGSTRLKAGTATKLILNMITVATMIKLGKIYKNWMVDVQPNSKKLTARALRLVALLGRVSDHKAESVFHAAGRRTKTAIVMARLGISRNEAEQRIKETSGYLYPILAS